MKIQEELVLLISDSGVGKKKKNGTKNTGRKCPTTEN